MAGRSAWCRPFLLRRIVPVACARFCDVPRQRAVGNVIESRVFVVPLKGWHDAKSRLRETLGNDEVEQLARRLADGVLRAIAGEATYVVTDDNEVESFARDLGAKTLREDAPGLNVAVAHAYRELSSLTQEIIIVHADLAKPEGLGTFPFTNDATVIRDHTGTGTNVLRLPSGLDATFFYGPDSAQRHVGELTRLGLAVQNVTDSPFGFDVDEPGDLHWS